MGVERIKRNCQIETDDVVQWSRVQILDKSAKIERIGKNWYIFTGHYKITVNAYSYRNIRFHLPLLTALKHRYSNRFNSR